MKKASILIIEDEQRLAEVLRKQFEEYGFEITLAYDGYIGKQLSLQKDFDLIILDINLPVINGYQLCQEIRNINKSIPILMLTALGTPDNKLAGFEVGADDYILKPFDFRELLARVNVFLRRSESQINKEILSIADLTLDTRSKSVYRAGKKIELTAKEFLLLEKLLKNKGEVLTRETIIEQVWGIDFDPGTNVIDVYMNYLRKKIDKDFKPKLIHNRYGFGFYCSESEI